MEPRHSTRPLRPHHWAIIVIAVVAVLAAGGGVWAWQTGRIGGPAPTTPPPTTAAPSVSTPAAASSESPALTPTRNAPTPAPTKSSEPTAAALAWGPSQADVDAAIAEAASLPVERVAGQTIIARYSGDAANAVSLIESLNLGGVILFDDNVGSEDDVLSATSQIAAAAAKDGRDWPAEIGVDQEGGTVDRLGSPWTTFPDFMTAGAASGAKPASTVQNAYEAQAKELRAGGFTIDFAPDADTTIGPDDVTIGTRSAGSDPSRVSGAVQAAVAGYLAGGVLPSIKHFPGHGSVTTDSHKGLPHQDAPLSELQKRDFVPFQAGIDAGTPMVMVGHIAVEAWDPDTPASLTPQAYQYLRETMGFAGVTITDGLDMDAVAAGRTSGEIAVQAVNAGADILLTPEDASAARQGLIDAVANGTLSRDRLDEAAGRAIAMMRYQAKLAASSGVAGHDTIGTAGPAATALSAAGVTVLTGQCDGPLIGSTFHLRGGTTDQWQAFSDAAARAGLAPTPIEQPADTEIHLVDDDASTATSGVAIAMDSPYPLADAGAKIKIALYGDTPTAFDAVIAVLTGKASAPGLLPVAVGDYPIGTGCR